MIRVVPGEPAIQPMEPVAVDDPVLGTVRPARHGEPIIGYAVGFSSPGRLIVAASLAEADRLLQVNGMTRTGGQEPMSLIEGLNRQFPTGVAGGGSVGDTRQRKLDGGHE